MTHPSLRWPPPVRYIPSAGLDSVPGGAIGSVGALSHPLGDVQTLPGIECTGETCNHQCKGSMKGTRLFGFLGFSVCFSAAGLQ